MEKRPLNGCSTSRLAKLTVSNQPGPNIKVKLMQFFRTNMFSGLFSNFSSIPLLLPIYYISNAQLFQVSETVGHAVTHPWKNLQLE